jgi:hypothetical protein
MKKLLVSAVLFAFIALVMTACSKGSNGATGATGPAGPQGSSSDNIQYSTWATLNMKGYIDANNDTSYVDTLIAPALTPAVLDKDVVVGYMMFIDANNDTTIANAATIVTETFGKGYIELYTAAPFASNSAGFNYSGYNYRYVVVPATVSVNSTTGSPTTYTRDQLKTMSYAKLSQILQLPSKGSKLSKIN